MNGRKNIILAAALLVLILAVHVLSLKFYFYSRVPFFDRIMHPVGGFVVGLVAVYLVKYAGVAMTRIRLAVIVMLSAIIVGVFWEWYELSIGFTDLADAAYASDTTADMISNIIGALLAFWYATKTDTQLTQTWNNQ